VNASDLARRWWRAIRPHSLGTAVAPVLVGGGLAIRDEGARPWAFALALLGVSLLLVGVNLANDYFDFRSGADPPLGVGRRPLQARVLAPRTFLVGSFAAFALAGLAGVTLVLASPPAVLLLGLAGAFFGFFYTAPPLRLGYRGLGEPVVFLTLGLGATVGAFTVTAGQFSLTPLVAALPNAALVTALLHANNLRDFATDSRTGKRTLAVRLGWTGALREYQTLLGLAALALLALVVRLTPWAALGLLLAPAWWAAFRAARPDHAEGGALMRATASLNLALAALLSLGFTLSRFL
jgi:1,4-dihydroxy-2-naphthoate octaprenyltransferase